MSALRALLSRRRARVLVMGVLNRTPDSFSDGGAFKSDAAAIERLCEMVAEGADIIDIGAESTRPGAPRVSDAEQVDRLGSSIVAAVRLGAVVSIDTTSPRVAAYALEQGAAVVNCVDPAAAGELGALCASRDAALVLMHCRGSMTEMPGFSAMSDSAYGDVVADVRAELSAAASVAMAVGLAREEVVLDPGLGFAKNARQSLRVLAAVANLCELGFPVLVGASRKSFLAHAAVAGAGESAGPKELASPMGRLGGSIAAALAAANAGAKIVRVHDVAATAQALSVWRAIDAARSVTEEGAHV